MPNMSGIEMSKKIRELKPDQIIALCTDYDNTHYLVEAIDIGIDKLILKPIQDESKMINVLTYLAKKSTIQNELKNKDFLLQQKNKIIDNYIYMTVSDTDGKIVSASQAYLDFTGYKEEEIIGEDHSVFRKDYIDEDVIKNLWETILKDKTWRGELKNHKSSGEEYWISTVISPLYDRNGYKIGYTSIKEDITSRKRLEALSITDSLTSVHNRRFFDHFIKRELKRSVWKKEKFAMLMIDVDYFKEYNDCYGHIEGDKALIAITSAIRNKMGVNVNDIFRVGGEEFAVVILAQDDGYVQKIANDLLRAVESLCIPHEKSEVSKYLTISIGVVNLDTYKYNINSDDLYNIADNNLYKAKRAGRNRIIFNVDESYVKNLTNIDCITKLPNRSTLIHDISLLQETAMLILLRINQISTLKDLYGVNLVQDVVAKKANQLEEVLIDGEASLYSLNLQEFAILVTKDTLFEKYLSLLRYSILIDNIDEDIYKDNHSSFLLADFTAGVAYGVENIFNHADVVLQEALISKQNYKIYTNNQTARQLQETTLARLKLYKNALHNDNVIPYFQPIIDIKDGSIMKYEALARLKTEDGEIITPYYFLDSAKEDKTFEYFTRQMMQKVFNVYVKKKVPLSMNLAYENIASKSMVSYIKNRLEKYGGESITFELLESEDIEDYTLIENFILMVKKYGCKVSIDDFGSGYSNFTKVIKLNIDYIKIDGTLIEKLITDENVLHMVDGIITYAKNANIETIAEYVSSKELADKVEEMGINYSQGYYYGEPKSAQSYDLI